MNRVIIYTDGSCLKNPDGPGGWGAIVICEHTDVILESLYGCHRSTTNNRMELTAALRAIESVEEPSHIVLHTDSQYLTRGMTEWRHKWKRTNFSTVKNSDLWRQLHEIVQLHPQIDWVWIKGHSGNKWNNRVDTLAKRGAKEAKLLLEIEIDNGSQDPYYNAPEDTKEV